MKKPIILALMLLVTQVGHLSALAETQIMARVKSDRVNLRAKSDLQAETVSQLSSGDMLAVRTVKDEWVEVVPPENADFWVHKEFVGDDTVLVARLNARSGAGINYNVVGSFVKGDKITRRGTFGEWIKVAAPADASLWVHRSLVELVYPGSTIPPPIAAPATPNPSEEISTYYDNSSEQPSPDNLTTTYEEEPWPSSGRTPPAVSSSGPPSDLKLVPLSGQGKVVQREGQLKRAPRLLFNSPGTHRLVKREGNKIITTAYLRGNSQQLDSLLEQNLVVQGREYWVENVRVPVIIIEGIEKRSFY